LETAASSSTRIISCGAGRWREFLNFTRYFEWYAGKLPFLLGLLLILNMRQTNALRLIDLLCWHAAFSLFLAFAYMINNISDLQIDARTGKILQLRQWSKRAKLILACVVGAVGLITVSLIANRYAVAGFIACYLLAWTYSFPPRFKEHIVLGPVIAAVGQLCAPAIVLLLAWQSAPPAALCYVIVMLLFGLRMIVVHQILDRDNDRMTGVRTTVLRLGLSSSRGVLQMIFALEMVVVILQIILLLLAGLAAATLALLALPLAHAAARLKHNKRLSLEGYEYIPLADLYESILPVMLAASLTLKWPTQMWWTIPVVFGLFANRHWNRFSIIYLTLRGL
jgi:4-hydroxybenzoate polyprenyltransferase